jgi:serine/threonine protein kinase
MHRDVKPGNVMIDHKHQKVRVTILLPSGLGSLIPKLPATSHRLGTG